MALHERAIVPADDHVPRPPRIRDRRHRGPVDAVVLRDALGHVDVHVLGHIVGQERRRARRHAVAGHRPVDAGARQGAERVHGDRARIRQPRKRGLHQGVTAGGPGDPDHRLTVARGHDLRGGRVRQLSDRVGGVVVGEQVPLRTAGPVVGPLAPDHPPSPERRGPLLVVDVRSRGRDPLGGRVGAPDPDLVHRGGRGLLRPRHEPAGDGRPDHVGPGAGERDGVAGHRGSGDSRSDHDRDEHEGGPRRRSTTAGDTHADHSPQRRRPLRGPDRMNVPRLPRRSRSRRDAGRATATRPRSSCAGQGARGASPDRARRARERR